MLLYLKYDDIWLLEDGKNIRRIGFYLNNAKGEKILKKMLQCIVVKTVIAKREEVLGYFR